MIIGKVKGMKLIYWGFQFKAALLKSQRYSIKKGVFGVFSFSLFLWVRLRERERIFPGQSLNSVTPFLKAVFEVDSFRCDGEGKRNRVVVLFDLLDVRLTTLIFVFIYFYIFWIINNTNKIFIILACPPYQAREGRHPWNDRQASTNGTTFSASDGRSNGSECIA